jgi:hypothetical protein
LQIVLTILEDSSLVEELLLIDYSADTSGEKRVERSGESGGAHIDSSESKENEPTLCKKSMTEDFLLNTAGLIDILYKRNYHITSEDKDKNIEIDKHEDSDPKNSSTSNSSSMSTGNGSEDVISSVTPNSCSRMDSDGSEMLLLCLNVLGAGVSYPPRDLGSALRGRIGGESKVLDTCCKILMRNEKRKTDFIAQKVKDRETKAKRLAKVEAEESPSVTSQAPAAVNRMFEGRLSDPEENKNDNCSSSSSSSSSASSSSSSSSSSSHQESGYNGERERPLTEEEQMEGELVKAALQVIGNMAYGCASVQVLLGFAF